MIPNFPEHNYIQHFQNHIFSDKSAKKAEFHLPKRALDGGLTIQISKGIILRTTICLTQTPAKI